MSAFRDPARVTEAALVWRRALARRTTQPGTPPAGNQPSVKSLAAGAAPPTASQAPPRPTPSQGAPRAARARLGAGQAPPNVPPERKSPQVRDALRASERRGA